MNKKSFACLIFILISLTSTSQNADVVFADTNKGMFVLVNKTHKLSKDFVPDNLVKIAEQYGDSTKLINKDAYQAFVQMCNSAKLENISLWITSAYRTYAYQNWLYNHMLKKQGITKTNRDTAKPGFSEHQTGLAIDIVQKRGFLLTGFEKTKQFEWLSAHAYKFGFILRYPKEKESLTGYLYEPWHYRYVGIETAKKITEKGLTYEEYYEQFINNQ